MRVWPKHFSSPPVSVGRAFAAQGCSGGPHAEDPDEQGRAGNARGLLQASPVKGGVLPAGPCHVQRDLPTALQVPTCQTDPTSHESPSLTNQLRIMICTAWIERFVCACIVDTSMIRTKTWCCWAVLNNMLCTINILSNSAKCQTPTSCASKELPKQKLWEDTKSSTNQV